MHEPTIRQTRAQRHKLDADLDRALTQTFPASDPFSVGQATATEPPGRPMDREAPRVVIDAAVDVVDPPGGRSP